MHRLTGMGNGKAPSVIDVPFGETAGFSIGGRASCFAPAATAESAEVATNFESKYSMLGNLK